MSRITVELAAGNIEYLTKHGAVEVRAQDATGGEWAVRLTRTKDGGVTVELAPVLDWAVRVEGVSVGSARGDDPAEAAREALRAAEVTHLPEAVCVQIGRDGEAWVMFTLDGKAYCVPQAQFGAEVEKSGRWVDARARRGREIDALHAELRKAAGRK